MPEVLVVAVPNTDRLRDMPIPDAYGRGGEERFLSFLADELTPLVDRRYRTQPLRVLSGHSQGGLFAVYAMATRPDAFSWIVAIDAPLFGVGERLKDAVRRLVQEPGYRGRLVSVERTLGWLGDWDALAAVDAPGFRAHRRTSSRVCWTARRWNGAI